jgi:peptide/nickel transport system permease protein
MLQFITQKILYSLFILWGVVSLVFLIFGASMGDPAQMSLGERSTEESMQAVRKEFALDQPIGIQYLSYLNDISPLSIHSINPKSAFYYNSSKYSGLTLSVGSLAFAIKTPYLRASFQTKRSVSETIAETFPNTLILAISAMSLASLLGILLGLVCALFKETWLDKSILFVSTLGMSLPSFFAAILMAWVFAYLLGPYTGLNLTGNWIELDPLGDGMHVQWKNLILPAVTLGIRPLSVIVQLMRSSILDHLGQDYIRTARAKGLSESSVLRRHALPNALNPVITAISGWFASMLAGVIFVEYIFGWKGMGFILIDSLNSLDLPMVMGCVMVISLIFVAVNLMVDILYSLLDPRIRLTNTHY